MYARRIGIPGALSFVAPIVLLCSCGGDASAAAVRGGSLEAGGLRFNIPSNWASPDKPPIEFVLPGNDADVQHAILRVDVLPSGTARLEVDRIVSDFAVESRPPVTKLGGNCVIPVDCCYVEGEYRPSDGTGKQLKSLVRPDWACIVAVVSAGEKDVLFAACGPKSVVQSHKPALEAVLSSARR